MKKTNEKLEKITKVKKEEKQMKKKETKKNHKWLKRFIAVEYILVFNVILITNCGYEFNSAIKNYQNSINELKHISNTIMDKHYNQVKNEVKVEQTNYMGVEEKTVITEPEALQTQNTVEDNKVYLGRFKITHYCACKKCCGANAQGITASGKRVEEGKTIAVDTKVIKMGSKVLIDGYGTYEAQDTGSAIKGNIIDVYVADHNQALKMGVQYKDVYLVK